MPLYFPDIYDFKLGTTGVTKIMLGDEQVWPIYKYIVDDDKVLDYDDIDTGMTYVIANDNYHIWGRFDSPVPPEMTRRARHYVCKPNENGFNILSLTNQVHPSTAHDEDWQAFNIREYTFNYVDNVGFLPTLILTFEEHSHGFQPDRVLASAWKGDEDGNFIVFGDTGGYGDTTVLNDGTGYIRRVIHNAYEPNTVDTTRALVVYPYTYYSPETPPGYRTSYIPIFADPTQYEPLFLYKVTDKEGNPVIDAEGYPIQL